MLGCNVDTLGLIFGCIFNPNVNFPSYLTLSTLDITIVLFSHLVKKVPSQKLFMPKV